MHDRHGASNPHAERAPALSQGAHGAVDDTSCWRHVANFLTVIGDGMTHLSEGVRPCQAGR